MSTNLYLSKQVRALNVVMFDLAARVKAETITMVHKARMDTAKLHRDGSPSHSAEQALQAKVNMVGIRRCGNRDGRKLVIRVKMVSSRRKEEEELLV